jgi:hypothetical protein
MDRRGVRPGDGRQSPRRAARRWSAADGKTPAALLPYVQSRSFDPFFQGLRELGYVNGHTITIDYLSADGQVEKFPTLAADCLRLKTDIIVATTTLAAQAAKNATRTTPIVMHALGDPVASGLVVSLGRPGGNVTGVSMMSPGLAAKRLELLKEVLPRLSRALARTWTTDLKGRRIRVYEVSPGPTETPAFHKLLGSSSAEAKKMISTNIPLGRLGTPEIRMAGPNRSKSIPSPQFRHPIGHGFPGRSQIRGPRNFSLGGSERDVQD